MKKKICLMMAFLMTAGFVAGCGKKGSEMTSMDIKYNVDDYVTLCDYEGLDVTVSGNYATDDAAVDEYLRQTLENVAPYIKDDSKTVIEADSVVNVDYVGKQNGEAFDGGSAQNVNINIATNSDAVQGTGYIEGFSSGLVGHSVGEVVDCDVTFPSDYGAANLAGQTVTFTFTVNFIGKKADIDTITDDYVSENFNIASVDDLKKTAKEAQSQVAENSRNQDVRTAVIDKMVEECKVKFPKKMVELRVEEYKTRYKETYIGADSKKSLGDYLKETYNTTEEDFEKEIKKTIEDNLKIELIFEAVAKKQKIELDKKDFEKYVSAMKSQNGASTEEDLYKLFAPTKESGKKYLEKMYVENKAVEYVVEKAHVTEQKTETTAE